MGKVDRRVDRPHPTCEGHLVQKGTVQGRAVVKIANQIILVVMTIELAVSYGGV